MIILKPVWAKESFVKKNIALRAVCRSKVFVPPLRLSAEWAQLWNIEFGCADEKEFLRILTLIITGKIYPMKRVIVLSTLLVFQLNSSLTSAEAFQIYRTRPQARLGWQNGIDYFRIPTSECGTPDYKCSVFDALSGDQSCNCTCPGKKSTFTSFESKWSCIENSDVRANLQSQQYSKPGEKGNWTKYLPYTALFVRKNASKFLTRLRLPPN